MHFALSKRITGALLVPLAVLLALGCGDEPLAPTAVAGTYVLLSIDGDPLPASTAYGAPAGGSVEVIADTLSLAADGTGSIVTVKKVPDYPGPGDTSEISILSELRYETSGGGIAITYYCPPNALMLCIAGPHLTARLTPSGLIATQLNDSPQAELVYARVERLE